MWEFFFVGLLMLGAFEAYPADSNKQYVQPKHNIYELTPDDQMLDGSDIIGKYIPPQGRFLDGIGGGILNARRPIYGTIPNTKVSMDGKCFGKSLVRRKDNNLPGSNLELTRPLNSVGVNTLLGRRSLDTTGDDNLNGRSLDGIGGGYLNGRSLDQIGGGHLNGRSLDNNEDENLDGRSSESVNRKSNLLDSIGGGYLNGRSLDGIGGGYLNGRSLDGIGGGYLNGRSLDEIRGGHLTERRKNLMPPCPKNK